MSNETRNIIYSAIFLKRESSRLTAMFNSSGTTDNAMLWRQTFTAISCNWDQGDTVEMICKTQIKQGS